VPLFGKKPGKPDLSALKPSLDDQLMAFAADELLSGAAFSRAINRGAIPPPAFVWINRYVNQVPVLRCGETTEAWATYEDHGPMRAREELVALLARIAADGADLPVILAAENSVTLTLTLETIRAASSIVLANPERARETWGGGHVEEELAYREGQDSAEWLICEMLRERMLDVELSLPVDSVRRDEWNSRPDLVVDFALTEFDRLQSELRGTIPDGPPSG
jgi:hypothetical protein